jgi:precorrin-6B methylase 2
MLKSGRKNTASHKDCRGWPQSVLNGETGGRITDKEIMKQLKNIAFAGTLILAVSLFAASWAGVFKDASEFYKVGIRSRDGIGKYYMGREISHVMGHRGAGWLERNSREDEERTDLLLDFLESLPGETIADIGAGTGYFSLPLAQRKPSSRILAVDIQMEMLTLIARKADALGIDNVDLIQSAVDDPMLPADSVDVVFIVDAYHEFSHPREMMQGIVEGLRDGGCVVLVEYRGEDPQVSIKPLHKMTRKQAILEMEAVGLRWDKTEDFLPQQHVMVFTKPPR